MLLPQSVADWDASVGRVGNSWKGGCRDRNLALLDCRATLAMTEGDMRRKPTSVAGLTELGRVRLSKSFFMRDMLHSEIAQVHGLLNAPDDPELAIAAGTRLCEELLEPLQDRWGPVRIRSAYRSREVNALGNQMMRAGKAGYNCAVNEANAAHHIWDLRDDNGCMGATACVVVPAFYDA